MASAKPDVYQEDVTKIQFPASNSRKRKPSSQPDLQGISWQSEQCDLALTFANIFSPTCL